MGDNLFGSVGFRLPGFDRTQRFCVGQRMIVDVQLPQSADKADGTPGAFELDPVTGHFCEVHVARGCCESGPAEMISGVERP